MLRFPDRKQKRVRPAAVADMFYPANPRNLSRMIDSFLKSAEAIDLQPRALISPHAGLIYSGPVAASAYAPLLKKRDQIRRVFLIGPSHRVRFRGYALPDAEIFETPLGRVELDRDALEDLGSFPGVQVRADAHREEHSLEMQLIFLQSVLREFLLIPILTGGCDLETTTRIIKSFLEDPECLVVVSSDLSHYYDYRTARSLDRSTAKAICDLNVSAMDQEHACGSHAISALIQASRSLNLKAIVTGLRNSGDTAGARTSVVGYGSFLFLDPARSARKLDLNRFCVSLNEMEEEDDPFEDDPEEDLSRLDPRLLRPG